MACQLSSIGASLVIYKCQYARCMYILCALCCLYALCVSLTVCIRREIWIFFPMKQHCKPFKCMLFRSFLVNKHSSSVMTDWLIHLTCPLAKVNKYTIQVKLPPVINGTKMLTINERSTTWPYLPFNSRIRKDNYNVPDGQTSYEEAAMNNPS
jgi:hypothetical protein